MVTLVIEGSATFAELGEYMDAVEGSAALSYRKLVDATAGTIVMTTEELMVTGSRLRRSHEAAVGPVAVVLSANQSETAARFLGFLAAAKRPMRIFKRQSVARRWLESQYPGS